jgi:hypothetical protein
VQFRRRASGPIRQIQNTKGDHGMKKKSYGRYTLSATAAIKAAIKKERIFCNNSDRGILVSDGHYILSMDRYEYDAIARPVFQRDPGSFVFDKKGIQESDTSNIYTLYTKILDALVVGKNELMQRAPFITKEESFDLCYYYNKRSDFVATYNAEYMDVFAPGTGFYATSPKQPAIAVYDMELFAAVLPVNNMNADRIHAIKSFFVADPAAYESTRISELQKENEELKSRYATAENLFKDLQTEYETLKTAYEELKTDKPVITLETPAADPAAEADAEDTSANHKDPETLEDLTSIDGVELVINGKQTDSPVSWIYGAEKYQELLHKLGFKWSAKKSGYWKKGIAA